MDVDVDHRMKDKKSEKVRGPSAGTAKLETKIAPIIINALTTIIEVLSRDWINEKLGEVFRLLQTLCCRDLRVY